MPTIQFNFGYFVQLGALPFPVLLARLFLDGGWIIVLLVFLQGCWLLWVQSRQAKYGATVQNVILAIDIPRLNEQTPLAVEQIFSHLSGAYSGLDRYEKYWLGKFTPTFSFELVSVEGYVQYVVHCPKKYRDLVESSIYAQYPDAEITEIQDYTDKVPKVFPHPEWDAFGTEFALKKPSAYPIRTYPMFEHRTAEVMTFKDPISSVLEVLSNLKRGEQMWIQVLLVPTDDAWQKKSDELVDKTLGRKKPPQKSILDHALEMPMAVVDEMMSPGPSEVKKASDQPKMLALSPGERGVVEAIQLKASKIGFLAKIRVVYVGRRDVFSKGRYTSLKGAFNQFSSTNMNAFKGYGAVTPKGDYFWQRWSEGDKKSAIVRNYRNRSGKGAPHFILNTEELATIYHFPMMTVKAPLVKKTESKRAEPPSSLPTEDRFPRKQLPGLAPTAGDKDGDGLPDNLPFA